jgi:long-subunit fatty acid transport protein
MEHHFTAGVSYVLNDSISLNFGGFYAPKSSVTGTNALHTAQTITIEMTQIEVSAGIAWRF